MRRVIAVNLGGLAYQLDEDAYERLRAYLNHSERRLGSSPDRAEVLGDLERAIANHISLNQPAGSAAVVTDAEMESALRTVGVVEDLEPAVAAAEPISASAAYGVPAWQRNQGDSEYTRLPVFLLCLLFGWLGIHRFFVGKIGTGVLMLLTIGGLGIWLVIDLILIVLGEFRDSDRRKILRWT
jgi:hypothetical protein